MKCLLPHVNILLCFSSVILPLMTREAVFWLSSNKPGLNVLNNTTHDSGCLASFAFIYGTLPTAPPVVLFATMYNVEVDTVCTFCKELQ